MSKISLMLMAAPTALAGLAVPAAAQNAERVQAVVPYDDLDLETAAGRDALSGRVHVTIRRMCDSNARLSLREIMASRACATAAYESAEPQLAALFDGKNPALASRGELVVAAQ